MKTNLKTFPKRGMVKMLNWREDFEAELREEIDLIDEDNPAGYLLATKLREILGED